METITSNVTMFGSDKHYRRLRPAKKSKVFSENWAVISVAEYVRTLVDEQMQRAGGCEIDACTIVQQRFNEDMDYLLDRRRETLALREYRNHFLANMFGAA